MSLDRNAFRHQLKIYGPAALLVIAAFVLAYQFIQPAPPKHVVMATGEPAGAYHQFAKRYAEYLDREGITLELRPTAGTVENIDLLKRGEVSVAFVQGGVGERVTSPQLLSLGSVYYEPLWLFHRRELVVDRLGDLRNSKVAVGAVGSGTRSLATRLLQDNGVSDESLWLGYSGEKAALALMEGRVDAAFFVISAESPLIEKLLYHPDIAVADFKRADAYRRRYAYLSSLVLPEGVVDLADNIPEQRVRLLAATANLVVHPELHPAVSDLLLQAASDIHQSGGWFEGQDTFPMPKLLAYPLGKEADRYYEHGPPFLQRYLPFWAASLIDRLKVMLLPLLVLLFPLIKVMPPIYTWRMRARVYRWYDELEQAEAALDSDRNDVDWVMRELDRIEHEVKHIKVPLSFTDQLYHLRQHIELVRRQVGEQHAVSRPQAPSV